MIFHLSSTFTLACAVPLARNSLTPVFGVDGLFSPKNPAAMEEWKQVLNSGRGLRPHRFGDRYTRAGIELRTCHSKACWMCIWTRARGFRADRWSCSAASRVLALCLG